MDRLGLQALQPEWGCNAALMLMCVHVYDPPLLLLLLHLWLSLASCLLMLQRLAAMRSETLHKDELIRLLKAEVK